MTENRGGELKPEHLVEFERPYGKMLEKTLLLGIILKYVGNHFQFYSDTNIAF